MTGSTKKQDQALKVRENRARRAAIRQGLFLMKSARRDRRAPDYGTYQLTNGVEIVLCKFDTGFGLTLDEIERELDRPLREKQ